MPDGPIRSQLFGFPVNMDEADVTRAKVQVNGNLVDLVDLVNDPQTNALAGLTPTADSMPYFTSETAASTTALTAFARSILDDANEATFKATVNLEPGVDVQAYSANLASWSALATSAKQDASANLDAWSALATSAKANTSHTHSAADITSGVLDAARLPSSSSGVILQVVRAVVDARSNTTSTIPVDGSVPQNSEGTEYATVTITPKESGSTIVVEAKGTMAHSGASGLAIFALFKDSDASAFSAAAIHNDTTATNITQASVRGSIVTASLSAITFKLRIGTTSGTLYMNGNATDYVGSTSTEWNLTATEIKA